MYITSTTTTTATNPRWKNTVVYVNNTVTKKAKDLPKEGVEASEKEFNIDGKDGTSLSITKYGGWKNAFYLARQLAGWPMKG